MSLFNEEVRDQLRQLLANMKDEVNLVYFQQQDNCPTCEDTKKFLEEFTALTDKIKMEVFDFGKDKEKVALYDINKVPAIVVLDKNKTDRRVKFYGIPAGYEINSFLASLFQASGASEEIPEDLKKRISAIQKDIHIKVFVTPGCPHCSGAVITAHLLAYENTHVKAEMVECTTFPEEAEKYNVSGVPKIVINEKHDLIGNQPVTEFLKVIEGI